MIIHGLTWKGDVVAWGRSTLRRGEQSARARLENRDAQYVADAKANCLRPPPVREFTSNLRIARCEYVGRPRCQPYEGVDQILRIILAAGNVPIVRPGNRHCTAAD